MLMDLIIFVKAFFFFFRTLPYSHNVKDFQTELESLLSYAKSLKNFKSFNYSDNKFENSNKIVK